MNVIKRIFQTIYGVDSLNKIDENFLAAILFADANGEKKTGIRGMFTWLEYGCPAYHIAKGTFGKCSEGGRFGIWYDGDNYKRYKLGDSQGEVISHTEAVGYAVALRNVIDEIDIILSDATLDYIGDYINLDTQVKEVCAKWQGSPYWSENGDLCVYLLKYFYILYPSRLCSIYSDADLDGELVRLKISLPEDTSRLVKNGVIALAKRGLTGSVDYKKTAVHGEDGRDTQETGEINAEVGNGGTSYPRPVLKVTADYSGIVYLREKSYGSFKGTGWGDANPYTGADPKNAFFFTYDSIDAKEGYPWNTIKVQLEPGTDRYYYPYVAMQDGNDLNDVVIAGDIDADKSYELALYPYGYAHYSNWDWIDKINQDAFDKQNHCIRYFFGPSTTDDAIKAEIQSGRLNVGEWDGYQRTFNNVIEGVCNYFEKNYTYSFDFDFSKSNGDNVAFFLSGGTGYKGVCRHFASAATLILRYLNIVARYVTGYCCNVKEGETTLVTSERAHAWVEVYNPWVGWLIVDPTPPIPEAGDGEGNLNKESGIDPWLAENYERILYQELLAAVSRYYKQKNTRH